MIASLINANDYFGIELEIIYTVQGLFHLL